MSDEKDRRVHLTETPDTSHIKNVDVTHEQSDVRISAIAKFVFALIALMVVSFVLMWAMFRLLKSRSVDPDRSPMALKDNERLPPEPRLQSAPGFASDLKKTEEAGHEKKAEASPSAHGPAPSPKGPTWEMEVLLERWHEVLEKGPVDEHGQRYGMPIEQAKEEVLKQMEKQKAEGKKP